jgi:hypothetical protein
VIAVNDVMKKISLMGCLLAIFLAWNCTTSFAQTLTRRPLPKLDTKRGLYIKRDGTRLYKDPAPPKNRVFTYRRRDGRVVSTLVGPRRAYASKRRPAKRKTVKRRYRRTSSTRRR